MAEIPKEYNVKFVHDKGHTPCYGVAFYCKVWHKTGDLVRSKDFIMPNGEHPKSGELMQCGNCDKTVHFGELSRDKKNG